MKRAAVLMLTLLVGACSVAPPVPRVDVARVWRQRSASLSRLQHWTLAGRVAVSTQDDAWNAALQWRQAGAAYRIRIIAPLGQGTATLSGDADRVVLRSTEHPQPVSAVSAEALLQAQLGWRVPVEGMRYWVLGLPDPVGQRVIQLDDRGRLAHLQQAGWQVRFLGYQKVDGQQLPERIFMQNGDLRVRLAIERWRVGR